MGRGIVKIGTKMVDMLANAASPVIYRRIFQKDFLLQMDPKGEIDTNAISELGYIMHLQTQMTFKEIIDTITEEDFYAWLEEFEAMDVMMATGDIFALFKGQEKTLVTPKKKNHRRTGNKRPRSSF